ncbi:Uncharacterised protein [Pseudomonas luteola]|uniref:Uncharacterized protein n=1 Tax=Pseudomonas luteola TaxID=47886 RepID=A0A2X2CA10_PSELU|nr:hypothetical protein [Pseudomonas luteola]SPZ02576.1 Uncharacterised protein [Pseudomonas luteola]
MSNLINEVNGVWHVPLSANHPEYQSVGLRRRHNDDSHTVIIVDVKRLIEYSDNDLPCYVKEPVEQWSEHDKQGVFDFLKPPTARQTYIEMPIVAFGTRTRYFRVPRFKIFQEIFQKTESEEVNYVSYVNGRHRTRYLAYAGAIQMPVMCSIKVAESLRLHCGA